MSAPVLWVGFPLLIAGLSFFVRGRPGLAVVIGSLTAGLLTLLAVVLPVEQAVVIGPWSLRLEDSLSILGRRFILGESELGIVALIYFFATLWFSGSAMVQPGPNFVPLGLALVACLLAMLLVEPFLFAPLLSLLAVFISIPMLQPPGSTAGSGLIRYLTFQSLGVPFILFTGSALVGSQTGELSARAESIILMGFGFALLLGVFPFHSWIPMLAEQAEPYVVGFLLFLLPLMVSLFGLRLLIQNEWLSNSVAVFTMLRFVGLMLMVTGGIWATFQRNLGRIFGHAILIESGAALAAIGLEGEIGLTLFFALAILRGLAYLVWALAMSFLTKGHDDLDLATLGSLGRRLPTAAGALLLAQFSLAGFPLTAGFPFRMVLWESLSVSFPEVAVAALLGSLGLFIAGLRTFSSLFADGLILPQAGDGQSPTRVIFLLCGAILLFLGLFPGWILSLAVILTRQISQI